MLEVNKSWTDCVGFGHRFVMVTGPHGGNVDRNRAADWHRNPQIVYSCLDAFDGSHTHTHTHARC